MEIIPGVTLDFNFVIGIMIKISMLLIFVLSLVTVRQESLMRKVVNFPVGGGLKMIVWGFCLLVFVLTVIVVLV